MLNIKPISDRVLIEPLEVETKTTFGIIIPDTIKEKPVKGIVAAIGIDCKEIKVGDEVIFAEDSGAEINFEEKNYIIMREDEIYAII